MANNGNKVTCRCCGQEFQMKSKCPFCGFPFIAVLGGNASQVESDAKKWRETHANKIIKSVGVVFNQPASWNGDTLKEGAKDYLNLGDLTELSGEWKWDESTEFASFGGGEDAALQIYVEHLDGSREERAVPIKLPPVRGITWKAAVKLTDSGDGVEFAVGVPEKFTKTEAVKFRV